MAVIRTLVWGMTVIKTLVWGNMAVIRIAGNGVWCRSGHWYGSMAVIRTLLWVWQGSGRWY
ncbi:unnamed protein product, partial [Staurois parvus]